MSNEDAEARIAAIQARWAKGTGKSGPAGWPLSMLLGGYHARTDMPWLLAEIDRLRAKEADRG